MEKSKKVKIIGNSIFFSIILVMVTFFVWNFIDIKSGYKYPIFGLRNSVILTSSMATVNDSNTYITNEMKQYQKNDVVVTTMYKNFDSIKIYDVATYYTGSKNLICHRIVNKYVADDGTKYVVFRGDANNIDDAPVSFDLVRGKVINVIPKVGKVVLFLQSPYVFIALFGVGFFVCLGLFVFGNGKSKKEKDRELVAEGVEETPIEEPIQEEQAGVEVPPVEEAPVEETSQPVDEENSEESIEKTPPEEVEEVPQEETNEKTSE